MILLLPLKLNKKRYSRKPLIENKTQYTVLSLVCSWFIALIGCVKLQKLKVRLTTAKKTFLSPRMPNFAFVATPGVLVLLFIFCIVEKWLKPMFTYLGKYITIYLSCTAGAYFKYKKLEAVFELEFLQPNLKSIRHLEIFEIASKISKFGTRRNVEYDFV